MTSGIAEGTSLARLIRRVAPVRLLLAGSAALLLAGCAQLSAVQLVGSAVGAALEMAGVTKGDGAVPKPPKELKLRISPGEQLNLASNGKPLSLVTRVYVLKTDEKMKSVNYQQMMTPENDKETFGEDLVSSREIVLLPGKVQELTLKVPGDATTIGIVGMYRAPFGSRWKIGFDAKRSSDNGITIGAHACAFSVSQGVLDPEVSPESMRSLVGVQCNS